MNFVLYAALAGPFALAAYAYLVYPALLRVLALRQRPGEAAADPAEWPTVSITVPVRNEAAQMADLLDSLLALDYPADRRQIMIVSDACDDGTDDVVHRYADRGVELLRMPTRGGKTAAESAAAPMLRGDIVVNTDASIRIAPHALKRLVRVFSDPSIGAASGRDVSVARAGAVGNEGEAGYVGYEMRVRALETRVHGIVGASGCFYAIRAHLHRAPLPDWLSRDFAAPMIAREHGYRTVSVDDAICFVPRTTSLRREYPRKVRTMMRGMETLNHKRHLLNPLRYGWFAWMLFSHKICRWAVPWSALPALGALAVLALYQPWAAGALALAVAGAAFSSAAWALQNRRQLPRALAMLAFAFASNVAAIHAAVDGLRGDRNAAWEPTRREPLAVTGST